MASTRPQQVRVLTRFMAVHNAEVIFLPQTVQPASRMLPWYKAAQTVKMLRFGFLRYSDRSFFGELDQSGMVATYNDTNFEDAKVVSEGLNFTKALASTTPNQPSMFYTAVLDVGQSGKRYGMAQCTRDLSKSDCGKCLDFQLATFLNIVGNKRNWDIHGSSCSMWYYDYQFYFNYSTPAAKGGEFCELFKLLLSVSLSLFEI